MTVNKRVLIDRLAPALGGRQPAARAIEAVLDAIVRAVVEGEPVSVTGFGTFETVQAASRNARNPQTGGKVVVPARRVPASAPTSASATSPTAAATCRRKAAPSARTPRAPTPRGGAA